MRVFSLTGLPAAGQTRLADAAARAPGPAQRSPLHRRAPRSPPGAELLSNRALPVTRAAEIPGLSAELQRVLDRWLGTIHRGRVTRSPTRPIERAMKCSACLRRSSAATASMGRHRHLRGCARSVERTVSDPERSSRSVPSLGCRRTPFTEGSRPGGTPGYDWHALRGGGLFCLVDRAAATFAVDVRPRADRRLRASSPSGPFRKGPRCRSGGHWRRVPGHALFDAVWRELPMGAPLRWSPRTLASSRTPVERLRDELGARHARAAVGFEPGITRAAPAPPVE